MALPQLQEHRFDMLAGSQRVNGEVRAGAIILKQSRTANGHPICVSAGGFDSVIAVRPARGPFQNPQTHRRSPVPPFGDLLFD
jgi:hypothetical protein